MYAEAQMLKLNAGSLLNPQTNNEPLRLEDLRKFLREYWNNPDFDIPTTDLDIPYYEEQFVQIHCED